MIRVILDELPDPLPREAIGNNTVLVDGIDKPAIYFNSSDRATAEALGGDLYDTENP